MTNVGAVEVVVSEAARAIVISERVKSEWWSRMFAILTLLKMTAAGTERV